MCIISDTEGFGKDNECATIAAMNYNRLQKLQNKLLGPL
jgi:hypothetical protein